MGFVYILTSKYYPGFVKIGATSRTGQHRADEINASAVNALSGWSVLFEREFEDYFEAESEVKLKLKPFREKGEVFNVKPEFAVKTVVDLWNLPPKITIPVGNFQPLNSVKSIGELIRKERKGQGLTQEQLAGVCGVGKRFIVELESGKDTIQLGKALHILNMLGIKLGNRIS